MDTTWYKHKLKTKRLKEEWQDILNNTFESMELYYRKQLSMTRVLSDFKKVFGITPITLKTSTDTNIHKYRILAIYILTKYSKEDFSLIAQEFQTSVKTIENIASSKVYKKTFKKEIKQFFKQFEFDFLFEKKSSLAFYEILSEKTS